MHTTVPCSFSNWPLFKEGGPSFLPAGVYDAPGAAEALPVPGIS